MPWSKPEVPPAPPPRTHASYVRKHSREVAPGECTTTTAPCSLCRCVGRCGHGHCLADQGESPIQVLPSSCATVTPPSCCPFKLRATLHRAHHWQHRRRQTLICPPRLAAEPHFGWMCPQHCLLGRGSTVWRVDSEHSHSIAATFCERGLDCRNQLLVLPPSRVGAGSALCSLLYILNESHVFYAARSQGETCAHCIAHTADGKN